MIEISRSLTNIPFGRPALVGNELKYIAEAIRSRSLAGVGVFGRRCEAWLQEKLSAPRVMLSHSCTHALEMAAILSRVGPGDEVIMPSFTFSSMANAFVLRGATPVFVDIRADTLNVNESLIEAAVTSHTRAIVPMHYAGTGCDMEVIMSLAERLGVMVIEDAAQAYLSRWRGRSLGTIGHLGCLSFHETKNVISGEGGALIINDPALIDRAELIYEKGTDRRRFLNGEVSKYTWQDVGGSYAPGELVAAFLFAQLEQAESVSSRRLEICNSYWRGLRPIAEEGRLVIPAADALSSNGHIFWILAPCPASRKHILHAMKERGVVAAPHYVPLHSSPAGLQFGRPSGELRVTSDVAKRLIRLPLHFGLTDEDVERVIDVVRTVVDTVSGALA